MATGTQWLPKETWNIRKGNSLIYIRFFSDQDSPEKGAFFVFKIYKTGKLTIGDLIKKDDGSYHYMMAIRSVDEPSILEHLRLNTQKNIYERISKDEYIAGNFKSVISPIAK
jgi:hypothetical protein